MDPKTEDLYETTLKRVYLVSCCPKLELSGHHRPCFVAVQLKLRANKYK